MSPCPFPFTQEAALALPRPRSSVRVFKQASPFPVSCQIIALGIQGSSASRRTKLKLELVELLRRNIVFPGDARAAHGQAPTAAVLGRASTPPWSRCDPQGTRPCWAAPGHKSLGSLQVGAVQGLRVGQGQRGLCCPQPLCPWGAFVLQPECSRGSPRRQARFGSALLLLCVAQHRSWKPQPRLLLGAVLGASYRAHPGGWGRVELSVALTPTPQAGGCQGSGSCGTRVPVSLHAPGTLLPLLSLQPRCCGHPEEAGWVFLG